MSIIETDVDNWRSLGGGTGAGPLFGREIRWKLVSSLERVGSSIRTKETNQIVGSEIFEMATFLYFSSLLGRKMSKCPPPYSGILATALMLTFNKKCHSKLNLIYMMTI